MGSGSAVHSGLRRHTPSKIPPTAARWESDQRVHRWSRAEERTTWATPTFAVVILVTALIGLLAVVSNRFTDRIHLPAPALFLVGAAVAGAVIPLVPDPPERLVERVVTVALLCILFDGGLHLGWSRFRSAAGPIAAAGIAGPF